MLAYGCTSASAVLGEAAVFSQLASRDPRAIPTTPATAAVAAFRALGTRKLGLVTPYVGEVNTALVRFFEEQGPWKVTALLTFNLSKDQEVPPGCSPPPGCPGGCRDPRRPGEGGAGGRGQGGGGHCLHKLHQPQVLGWWCAPVPGPWR